MAKPLKTIFAEVVARRAQQWDAAARHGLPSRWESDAEEIYAITGEVDTRKRELAPGAADGVRGIKLDATFPRDVERGKYALIHPATKAPGEWQLSWFDSDGAVGDTRRKTVAELIDVAHREGFIIVEVHRRAAARNPGPATASEIPLGEAAVRGVVAALPTFASVVARLAVGFPKPQQARVKKLGAMALASNPAAFTKIAERALIRESSLVWQMRLGDETRVRIRMSFDHRDQDAAAAQHAQRACAAARCDLSITVGLSAIFVTGRAQPAARRMAEFALFNHFFVGALHGNAQVAKTFLPNAISTVLRDVDESPSRRAAVATAIRHRESAQVAEQMHKARTELPSYPVRIREGLDGELVSSRTEPGAFPSQQSATKAAIDQAIYRNPGAYLFDDLSEGQNSGGLIYMRSPEPRFVASVNVGENVDNISALLLPYIERTQDSSGFSRRVVEQFKYATPQFYHHGRARIATWRNRETGKISTAAMYGRRADPITHFTAATIFDRDRHLRDKLAALMQKDGTPFPIDPAHRWQA